MDERIIVSLTTWSARIHNVEINRVSFKKTYKKLLPTLLKYPNDCIINIDDDWLYPSNMIADMINIHRCYPNNPISGNKEFIDVYPCHCGCASLSKASFYGNLNIIDDEVLSNCPSDDAVFTYFALRSGHPYIWTKQLYFTNMQPYNQSCSYSSYDTNEQYISISWEYLTKRFGQIDSFLSLYVSDPMMSLIIKKRQELENSLCMVTGRNEIRQTMSYRIGHFILAPLFFFSSLIKKKNHECTASQL